MKRLSLRLSGAVTAWLLLTSLVSPVAAQSKSVVVQRRDADMTILTNGDVQVIETWQVQFSGGPFTSAFRSIPLNKVTSIDGWRVADETQSYQQVNKGSSKQPYTFEYTIGDGLMKATWFFPSTTDQTRTFKVGYTLHGALRIDPAGDQFYWKFIEADRGYTINTSQVVLHLPAKFDSNQLKFTMYQNGVEQFGARWVDAQTLEFTGGSFAGGVEWEIRAQFPHGVVTASAPAWQANENQTSDPQNSVAVPISPQSQTNNQGIGVIPAVILAVVFLVAVFMIYLAVVQSNATEGDLSDVTDNSNSSGRSTRRQPHRRDDWEDAKQFPRDDGNRWSRDRDWDSSDRSSSSSDHDSGGGGGGSGSSGFG